MDWTDIYSSAQQIFSYMYVQILATIGAALVAQFILHRTIDRIVARVVRSHKYAHKIDEEKRERTLVTIFRTAVGVVLWVIVVMLILWQLQVNIAAFLTGAGLIGIVVGFGAQNAIRDILAGIFIISENQYRVGDIVTLNAEGTNISGEVQDITIRITRLRDLDGNMLIVRNGSVVIVTNLSFEFANVNVDVGVSYDSDIDKVERVINEVGQQLAEDEAWAQHIYEPIHFFRVDGFEDSAIRIKALGKVEPAMQWDIAGEFRRRLKKAFDKQNITIPFPQVVVHKASTK
ncbi:MAG: mechanosensitive ion channel family protein [Candidatus Saccharimonadales bacterium]